MGVKTAGPGANPGFRSAFCARDVGEQLYSSVAHGDGWHPDFTVENANRLGRYIMGTLAITTFLFPGLPRALN